MKIGVTCYPTYGGSGAVATTLGIELAERGHEVHFVSYAQPFRLGRFHERVFFHEVEMEQYPLFEHPPYTLALAVALHDAARTHDLDLIHVHYAIPHATSAWIAQQMLGAEGPPVVHCVFRHQLPEDAMHIDASQPLDTQVARVVAAWQYGGLAAKGSSDR